MVSNWDMGILIHMKVILKHVKYTWQYSDSDSEIKPLAITL